MSTELQLEEASRHTILVLGEDSSSRIGLTQLLSEDGFNAIPCDTTATALDSLSMADAMVVEQSLPHERLAVFLAKVVRKDPKIPVLVVSPYCDTETKLAEDNLKPRACFSMPIVYEDLVQKLREITENHPHLEQKQNEHEIKAETLDLFDKKGPRYTSYPTVPVFSDEFGHEQYEKALSSAGLQPGVFSLYVHLPFCRKLCTYCACNVAIRKDIVKSAPPYVTALLAEASLVESFFGKRRRLVELHIGGGSPNYFPLPQIKRLVEGLESTFSLSLGVSRTIEVDPRHLEDGQLQSLAKLGFSRISLGIQDIDPRVQDAIGRHQSIEGTIKTIESARDAGFDSVNIDLVYGLPAQTKDSFARTLDQVIELRPDRVAVFSFAYVPSSRPQQKKLDMSIAPTGRERAILLLDAMNRLNSAGYIQVGMDHFALPKDPLTRSFRDGSLHRNFQGYIPGPATELIGLGATSIGDIGGAYIQNHPSVTKWRDDLNKGILPVAKGWKRHFDDEVRRAVIQSLMCRFRLFYWDLVESFGIDHDRYFATVLPTLKELSNQGLITLHSEGISVTSLGRLFVRNIAMAYDAYLPGSRQPVSRTD